MPLILIPAGHFKLGQENDQATTDTYYIGKYPVTVEQYHCFIEADGYKDPSYWSHEGWRWRESHDVKQPNTITLQEYFLRPNHPQVGVSWHEANAFCAWISQHSGNRVALPNEMQWEKAARKEDGRKYPWGTIPPTDIYCNFDNGVGHTTPVGLYPAGQSPFGCYDMVGNVWEWCRNTEGPLPYPDIKIREDLETRNLVTKRGGSWLSRREELPAWFRSFDYPIITQAIIGFRVVVQYPMATESTDNNQREIPEGENK